MVYIHDPEYATMAFPNGAVSVENVTRCGYPQRMAEMTERERRLRTLYNAVVSAITVSRVSADDIQATVQSAFDAADRETRLVSAMSDRLPTLGRV
jgi:hypothetical protein